VFDIIASRTHGLVKAKDVRVVWTDGHLYICQSPTDITVFACDQPIKRGGMWKVQVGESTITFQPPGCGSCRARVKASPVGQMSVEEIVASVSVDA
jgi:hypothetical protein